MRTLVGSHSMGAKISKNAKGAKKCGDFFACLVWRRSIKSGLFVEWKRWRAGSHRCGS
jgi:hypothetical protein